MKQLTKNVPAESELLFGDDQSKRVTQINDTNSALANSIFVRTTGINLDSRCNKSLQKQQ